MQLVLMSRCSQHSTLRVQRAYSCTANPHLIEQKYLWVEEEGSRYGNALLLASRQPDSPLPHHRVIATLRKVVVVGGT